MKKYSLLLFPLFWVILGWIYTGDPLGFIHQVSKRKRAFTAVDSTLYNFLLLSVNSGIIIGIFYLNKNKRYLWIFITTLIIWQTATSLSGATATHNVWRTGMIWYGMLIPVVAYVIYRLYQHQKLFGILLAAIILYLSVIQLQDRSKESYLKIEDVKAGEFIKTLEGKIIMPRYQWHYTSLLVTSGKPIVYKDKITDLVGYDYLILMQQVKLPLIYSNKKWYIYKIKE